MMEKGRLAYWGLGLICACAALACDDRPEKPPAPAPEPPPTATAESAPKPAGPPDFEIDTLSAKVGFERALLDQRDGHTRLVELLKGAEKFVAGQDVSLRIDRSAKLPWVTAYIEELGKLGAKHVLVKTETRKEFASSLPFSPELGLKSPASCSVVAMVLEDRGTAVWKLSGGVATKHGKGMAASPRAVSNPRRCSSLPEPAWNGAWLTTWQRRPKRSPKRHSRPSCYWARRPCPVTPSPSNTEARRLRSNDCDS